MNRPIAPYFALLLTIALVGNQSAVLFAQQTSQQNQQPAQTGQPPIPGQPTMPPINPSQLPENPRPANVPPGTPQPAAQPAPETTQPTGTAAAQTENPAGTAGSKPAGAAIAPPRQRQVRSFLIKMGFIAGAGVALGTVYALSTASPSRVPGAPAH